MNDHTLPLLEAVQLSKHYPMPKQAWYGRSKTHTALCPTSFKLFAGRSLGVVGESGSGKSTLARLVMALEKPTTGKVLFHGKDLHALGTEALKSQRSAFQMVFQDPYGSLNPRHTILKAVTEPLRILQSQHPLSKMELRERAAQALAEVGLGSRDLEKFPHEFSGGQRQRIAIARALITRPSLIVADEPVSALDVSVQAQVLNLMMDLQERHSISYLLISHDLSVINLLCDEVIVLKDGGVIEQGETCQILQNSRHPYTKALMDAVPGRV